MPQRFSYTSPPVTVGAAGTAETNFTPRANVDVVITNTAVSVKVAGAVDTSSSTGLAFVNGQQIDGTSKGQNDSSDTRFTLTAGDNYRFSWTGASPGGIAQLHFDGVQYAAGTSPWE